MIHTRFTHQHLSFHQFGFVIVIVTHSVVPSHSIELRWHCRSPSILRYERIERLAEMSVNESIASAVVSRKWKRMNRMDQFQATLFFTWLYFLSFCVWWVWGWGGVLELILWCCCSGFVIWPVEANEPFEVGFRSGLLFGLRTLWSFLFSFFFLSLMYMLVICRLWMARWRGGEEFLVLSWVWIVNLNGSIQRSDGSARE